MNMLFGGGHKAFTKEWAGYSNSLVKWEVIGRCRARAYGHMSYRAAFEEVKAKENQPYVSTRPTGEAHKLHGAVARAMGINPERLQLYTAVDSSLEVIHGIDGFFVFEGTVVTFDVVVFTPRSVNTDILVTRRDILSQYESCAKRIAGCFGWKVFRGRGWRT